MNTTSSENSKKIRSSTSVRKKIWKTSFELIKKKWLFGYGTRIGKKKLENQYEKEGYTWMQHESLLELIKPERIKQIKMDNIIRSNRQQAQKKSPYLLDILDDAESEGCAACFI